MKLKKIMIAGIIAIATLTATTASAQRYNTALGVRLGYDNGLAVKHFISQSNALEGVLSISPYYFQITGMYVYQQSLTGAPNLDWYVGAGAHVGGINKNKEDYDSALLLGADLMAGMEYKFPTAPFAISLDWKPSINFTNSYNDWWYAGIGLSLRYTF